MCRADIRKLLEKARLNKLPKQIEMGHTNLLNVVMDLIPNDAVEFVKMLHSEHPDIFYMETTKAFEAVYFLYDQHRKFLFHEIHFPRFAEYKVLNDDEIEELAMTPFCRQMLYTDDSVRAVINYLNSLTTGTHEPWKNFQINWENNKNIKWYFMYLIKMNLKSSKYHVSPEMIFQANDCVAALLDYVPDHFFRMTTYFNLRTQHLPIIFALNRGVLYATRMWDYMYANELCTADDFKKTDAWDNSAPLLAAWMGNFTMMYQMLLLPSKDRKTYLYQTTDCYKLNYHGNNLLYFLMLGAANSTSAIFHDIMKILQCTLPDSSKTLIDHVLSNSSTTPVLNETNRTVLSCAVLRISKKYPKIALQIMECVYLTPQSALLFSAENLEKLTCCSNGIAEFVKLHPHFFKIVESETT
jgi:hypothetical protein